MYEIILGKRSAAKENLRNTALHNTPKYNGVHSEALETPSEPTLFLEAVYLQLTAYNKYFFVPYVLLFFLQK
jgi:hypothetical protein